MNDNFKNSGNPADNFKVKQPYRPQPSQSQEVQGTGISSLAGDVSAQGSGDIQATVLGIQGFPLAKPGKVQDKQFIRFNYATGRFEFATPSGGTAIAAFNWRGTWDQSESYATDDITFWNGSSYICIDPVAPVQQSISVPPTTAWYDTGLGVAAGEILSFNMIGPPTYSKRTAADLGDIGVLPCPIWSVGPGGYSTTISVVALTQTTAVFAWPTTSWNNYTSLFFCPQNPSDPKIWYLLNSIIAYSFAGVTYTIPIELPAGHYHAGIFVSDVYGEFNGYSNTIDFDYVTTNVSGIDARTGPSGNPFSLTGPSGNPWTAAAVADDDGDIYLQPHENGGWSGTVTASIPPDEDATHWNLLVGNGFTWKGAWQSGSFYYPFQVVIDSGSTYLCYEPLLSEDAPRSDSAHWMTMTVGFNWKGPWVSAYPYAPYDVVSDAGSTYVCIASVAGPIEPGSDSAHWQMMASQGAPGQGFTWKGIWNASTSYVPYDVAFYAGSVYNCILAVISATTPDVDTTHWELMASQGAPGSVWYNSHGVPASGTGINGDYDLDLDTGNIYQKQSGSWTLIGQLVNIGGGQPANTDTISFNIASNATTDSYANAISAQLFISSNATTP